MRILDSTRVLTVRRIEAADADREDPRAGAIKLEADDIDAGSPFCRHAVSIAAIRQRDLLHIFIIDIYRD
jgi:hypothetical protein